MRKFALAMAAVAAVAFTAPAFAASEAAPARMQLAQADVKVKVKTGDRGHMRKKVVVRHDRGRHMGRYGDRGRHVGWRHSNHGGKKVVVIKKQGHGKTIIKKKITHG